MFILYYVKNINISFIFLILGAVIGAGFSSGKEISVFFPKNKPLSFIIIFIIAIFLYFSLCEIIKFGRYSKAKTIKEINKELFTRNASICSFFIIIGVFIFFTTMIAGLNALGKIIFNNINFPVLTIICLFFSFFICEIGHTAIKKVNAILMPFIIFFLIFVTVYNIFLTNHSTGFTLLNPQIFIKYLFLGLCYISYNLVFSCSLITENSINFSDKEMKYNSLIFSIVLCGLLLIINTALLQSLSAIFISELPMLDLSFNLNNIIGYFFSFILLFSILTSMITTLYILTNTFQINRFLSSSIIITVAFIFSFFGFENIIVFIYPIQGALSLLVIIKVFIYNQKKQL